MDKEEQERLEDLKERDEFAQRLKDKDKDGTKKVCNNSTRSQLSQLSSLTSLAFHLFFLTDG
jgi:pre-mRNA-splicing factor ATP-dependent RNA helicase DHX16